MTRDRATRILRRILATIDAGSVPVRVDGVWVFGSYARGSLEPGDIDLIIVHEKVSETLRAKFDAEAKTKNLAFRDKLYYSARRHHRMITAPLRKPGESVDMLLGWTLEEVLSSHSTAKNGRLVRLWTPQHRDWQAALESITPDPTATRAERREFIKCKRAGCSLQEMQRLTTWIEKGAVAVERLRPPEWPVRLSKIGRERIERLTRIGSFGKASQKCLPMGAWWLERCGCKRIEGDRGELNNERYGSAYVRPTLRVTFGTLHPWRISWFLGHPGIKAVAHVLHFKKGEPPEVLEFRRGPAWAEFKEIDRDAVKEDQP